ncbi:MAG: phosphoribosylformylglycinamidine synthase [Candidatus Staskawiczbacteria bacterium RIFOXYB1_FULL_37_44]|uniref:Phosphoribosylformylglycinamidine synthase n=1 Tax=Candidatus Staskawiczbacteria bacterium RIFOXYB1_FULL_37_44 TaxID=1802223 RepID=A0A1G2IVQ4_9BACT|nr:MAG: phosphoribosylformylglycinamidine synthase [Candidatus Staskawiczbacteria bacterium RIFOXYB1_FULL_37_44]OGZ83930.1 MAG: phosphoribosylformylglycinamidine synthase [Candidatus Staskawiczbacteria bacterium RIFOXYC1_FULL_37_52]OGZ88973.1 MAG: phosphoribosylformylglycinamidine synthase [Candidatus Staskawiczbacteria bacterium RIFOXYC2_FULL_37_19]
MLTKIVRNFGLFEACFYVETVSELTAEDLKKLRWVITETFEPFLTYGYPFVKDYFVEIGPRINVETPFSTNAVAICHAMGLDKVTRIEQSRMYCTSTMTREKVLSRYMDCMTQCVYPAGGLTSFDLDVKPAEVQLIPVLERGEDAIRRANKQLGLGMDEWDVCYYTELFRRYGRNPTDVELFQIGNANSEHSRHWYFKGKQVIDGKEMPECLLDIVRAPLRAISGQNVSVLAFNDNVGALHGFSVPVFVPEKPSSPSAFRIVWRTLHPTATAETHNHPTMWAPYPGAATKIGGRIRDTCAGGQGSLIGFGTAGYCVGNLFIPNYKIAGEVVGGESTPYASALRILIEGSNGDFDYGNQFGEPTIGGFCRTFEQVVSGEKRGYRKPIFYGGGVGHIDGNHTKKHTPEKGMEIMAEGGPGYAIGEGGGAQSSVVLINCEQEKSFEQERELAQKSVQRGNGEMGNKAVRVIRACVEMGDENPIESIHDQGAGGPSNVLTELMETVGGKVDIRKIFLGDKTMSVPSIWSAEYQERYGLLKRPDKAELFQSICARERVNCEMLGEITGDGYVTVIDSVNNTTPVHLNLADILGKLPQKTFKSDHLPRSFTPPELPSDLTVKKAIEITFQQLSVGSKGFLVRKVDRSVGGLIAQQQCCGASQVPIANIAVGADSYFGLTGVASALGEQPLKMLIDPKAGARMAVGEMLTNLMSAGGIDLSKVRCRANWMWPAKMPGEGALMYDAAVAMRDAMIALGIAPDGGKDSLSMAATVDGELVKAPGELVILGYASMPDITKVLTPDIKAPGESYLGLIDLGLGKNRLGGSALLQALNQIGDETPDCDPDLLKSTWKAIQILHDCGVILSLHDRSDGGLATTVIEMCFGGNCGLDTIRDFSLAQLFSEELGLVIEYDSKDENLINRVLEKEGASPCIMIGKTTAEWIPAVFGVPLTVLRMCWEATSHQLEKLQTKNGVADEEFATYQTVQKPVYHLGFTPSATVVKDGDFRPKVAVVREEGTNGDREMAAAFYTAGLDPVDVTMSDLLSGRITLEQFQGLVAPGGFSFMDVFDSAKGWAGTIRFNPKLRGMFDRFYDREDTFTLGVCNGCQLFALLGWVPWKGLDETIQPRFIRNRSERFESRWIQVKIQPSPSVLLAGMEGSTFGVHVAHGEGRLYFPDSEVLRAVREKNLTPLIYVDSENEPTEKYPVNPNGSVSGIAALCSPDGRHLAMMPHPERAFLPWQWHYWPLEWSIIKVSPWLKMFQNARRWCVKM